MALELLIALVSYWAQPVLVARNVVREFFLSAKNPDL